MTICCAIRRACLTVVCALALSPSVAHAQTPNPNEADLQQPAQETQGSGGGEPWYGYAAWGFVAVMGLFLVCKSARRS